MRTVGSLLQIKGRDVWSVAPDASVYQALEILAEKNVGALLVCDRGEVVGIVSERDYARRVELQGKSAREMSVGEIMTRRVVYVRPEQTMEDCMALMTEKRIRHLPVLDEDGLIGVISIGDVVKEVIAEQQFMIRQLENYIVGRF
jgi:CBS domain-containing protein